jgi:hypothetical protein
MRVQHSPDGTCAIEVSICSIDASEFHVRVDEVADISNGVGMVHATYQPATHFS